MRTINHGGNIFEIARERGWDWRDITDFSASINPLGPSPAVAPALRDALDRIVHYPEREPAELRRALARLWDVDESRILLGNGATELIHWFARICMYHPVTLVRPIFSEFDRAFPFARSTYADVPFKWPADGLLVLTNPLIPDGAPVDFDSARDPLFVDESFLDFTGLPSIANSHPNAWVLRSLTKFYALPGLRVGALIGPADQVEQLRALREPWQVNVLAEAAALAAIADRDHAWRTIAFVRAERNYLMERIPWGPAPSIANYIHVPSLPYPAADLAAYLLERKILIRQYSHYGIRIAVRTRAENDRLLTAWKDFDCGR